MSGRKGSEGECDLWQAIQTAERLRSDHNGIGGVYLYLGHDGDNVCNLRDGDHKEIGKGQSGRSLLEAVQWAEADWLAKGFWRRWKVEQVLERVTGVGGIGSLGVSVVTPVAFAETVAKLGGPQLSHDEAVAALDSSDKAVRVVVGDSLCWYFLPPGLRRSQVSKA